MSLTELFDSADIALFQRIVNNPLHVLVVSYLLLVLYPLLHAKAFSYNFRKLSHGLTLPPARSTLLCKKFSNLNALYRYLLNPNLWLVICNFVFYFICFVLVVASVIFKYFCVTIIGLLYIVLLYHYFVWRLLKKLLTYLPPVATGLYNIHVFFVFSFVLPDHMYSRFDRSLTRATDRLTDGRTDGHRTIVPRSHSVAL